MYYLKINAVDPNTLLFETIKNKTATPESVGALIRLGANVNARDDRGNTPLILATWMGNLPVVQTLIRNRANTALRNLDDQSPLHLASILGLKDIVNELEAADTGNGYVFDPWLAERLTDPYFIENEF